MKKNINRLLILSLCAACISCGGGDMQGRQQMPKTYRVAALEGQSASYFDEFPTLVEGVQTVELRSKVSGYIAEILVDEGATVRKGQLLFKLDANDLEASVRSADAQVKVAETAVEVAKINLEKTKPLVEKQIVSQFELATVKAELATKEAQLAQAKANYENAKANLSYTRIVSPTDGVIGRFPYRVGSLVSSNSAEPLTVISNTREVYAYFSMNEKLFLSEIGKLEGASVQAKLKQLSNIDLILADGSLYGEKGQVETASGVVDSQTGAVSVRVRFENPNGLLRSGSSGRIRIPRVLQNAIVIPQKATYELQEKHYVYLYQADSTAVSAEVEVMGAAMKDAYVVTKGLNVGDKLIVEGIASLRQGAKMIPVMISQKEIWQAAEPQQAPKQ